ncbi:hypothetical protein HYH02_010903 [Chlamydomonas schloesseri]|uniref:Uncharacterized protein n=1 Tax=Chlamydomonas schloesseri TaxID=2026947 RepID=A0A835W5U7_9CHLO|nr:hypothetical protein HYH02_010903 [Chlamydomonas schloesseri]|eukprot:KAG2438448.1 hypothetical protein HYH02_010903 [Chlamydomonas schloesseri]
MSPSTSLPTHTPTTPAASSILANLTAAGAMVPQTPSHANSQAKRLRSGAAETPIASTSAAGPARPSTEPAPPSHSCCPIAAGREPSAKSEVSYDCSVCPGPVLGESSPGQQQETSAVAGATPAGVRSTSRSASAPLPLPAADELPLERQQQQQQLLPRCTSAGYNAGEGSVMPESTGTCHPQAAPPPQLPPTPLSSSAGFTAAQAERVAQPQQQQQQQQMHGQPPPPPQQHTQCGLAAPTAGPPEPRQPTAGPAAATGISSSLPAPAAAAATTAIIVPPGGPPPSGPTSPSSSGGRSSRASAPTAPTAPMCTEQPPTPTTAVAATAAGTTASPVDSRPCAAIAGTAGAGGAPSTTTSLNALTPELLLRVMQAAAQAAAAEQRAAATAARAAGRPLLAFLAEVGDVAPGFTPTPAVASTLLLEADGAPPTAAAGRRGRPAAAAVPVAALRSHCLGVAGVSRELRVAVQQLLRHPKDAAAVLHARDGPAASAASVFGWPELRRSLLGEVPPRAQPPAVQPAAAVGVGPSPGCGAGSHTGDIHDAQAQAQAQAHLLSAVAAPSCSCSCTGVPPPQQQQLQQQQQQAHVGAGASPDGSSASCGRSGGSGLASSPTHMARLGCEHHSLPHAAAVEGVPAADPPPLPHPLQLRSVDAPVTVLATQSAAAGAPAPPAEPGTTSGTRFSVPTAGGNRRSRRAASRSSACEKLAVEVEAWAEAAAGKLLALATELAALQGVPVWVQGAGLVLAAKEARLDCLRRAGQRRRQQQQQEQADRQQAGSSSRQPRQRHSNPEADALLALSRHLASHPLAVPPPVVAGASAGRATRTSTRTTATASPTTGTCWPLYTAHLIEAAAADDVRLLQALLGPPLPRLASELPAPLPTGPKVAAEAAAAAGLRRPDPRPTAPLLRPRRPLGARPWLPVGPHVLVVALGAAVAARRLAASALLVLQYGTPPDVRAKDPARDRRIAPVALLGRALVAAGAGNEAGVRPALTRRQLKEAVDGADPEWTELCLAAGVWRRHELALSAVPDQQTLNRHWPGCPAAASDLVVAVAAGRAADGLAEALAEARAEEEVLNGRDEAREVLRRAAASGRAASGATARVLLRYLWTYLQCPQVLGAALGAAVHASAVQALVEATPRGALHSLAAQAQGAAAGGEGAGGEANPAAAMERSRLLLQGLLSATAQEGEATAEEEETMVERCAASGEQSTEPPHARGAVATATATATAAMPATATAAATAAAAATVASRRRQQRLLDTLPGELAALLVEAAVVAARGGRVEAVRTLLLSEQEAGPAPLPPSQEVLARVLEASVECPRTPAAVELVRLLVQVAATAAAAQAPHQQQQQQQQQRHQQQPLRIAELLSTALTAAAERRRTHVAVAVITAATAHLTDAGSSSSSSSSGGDATVVKVGVAALTWVAREVVAPAVLRALQAGAADALATVIAAAVMASAAAAPLSSEAPAAVAAAASDQGAGGGQAAGLSRQQRDCSGGLMLMEAVLSELDAGPGPAWRPAAGDAALALLALPPPPPSAAAAAASVGPSSHLPAAATAACMPPAAGAGSGISARLATRFEESSTLFALKAAARAGGGGGRRLRPGCCLHCIGARHTLYQCPHCCWYTPDGQAVVPARQAATDQCVWGITLAGAAQAQAQGIEERVRARAAAIQALLSVGGARAVRWQPLPLLASSGEALHAGGADGGSGGGAGGDCAANYGRSGRDGEFVSQPVLDRLLLQVSRRAVSGSRCCSGSDGGDSTSTSGRHRDDCGQQCNASMRDRDNGCEGCQYLRQHDSQQPLSADSARTLLSVLAGSRKPAVAAAAGYGPSGWGGGGGQQHAAVGLPAAGGMRASLTAVAAAAELVCSETAKLVEGCEAAATAADQASCCVVPMAPVHVLAQQQVADAAGSDGSSSQPVVAMGVCSGPNVPPRPLPHPLPPALRAAVAAASAQQRRERLVAVLTALLPPPHALITTSAECSSTERGTTAAAHHHQAAAAAAQARLRHLHPQQQVGPYVPGGGGGCLLRTGALDEAVVAAVAAGSVEAVEVLLAAAPLSPGGLCRVLRAVGLLATNRTAIAVAGGGGGGGGGAAVAGAGSSSPPAARRSSPATAMLAAVRRRYQVPQAVLDWLLGEAAAAAAVAAAAAAAAAPNAALDAAMGAVWLWRRAGASPWPWLLASHGGRMPQRQQQQQGERDDNAEICGEQQPPCTCVASEAVAARLAMDGLVRPLLGPRAGALRAGVLLSSRVRGWMAALDAWCEQNWGWL